MVDESWIRMNELELRDEGVEEMKEGMAEK
jgi:hypothetical protein